MVIRLKFQSDGYIPSKAVLIFDKSKLLFGYGEKRGFFYNGAKRSLFLISVFDGLGSILRNRSSVLLVDKIL